jgi:hypothetical protein
MNVTNIFHKNNIMTGGCFSRENSKKYVAIVLWKKMAVLLPLLLEQPKKNMKTDSLQANISWYAKLF